MKTGRPWVLPSDSVFSQHPQFLAADALDYVRLARDAAERKQVELSIVWYRKALQFWHHANEQTDGRWVTEQRAAAREYADLIRGRRRIPPQPPPSEPWTGE
jgi:hypothetical protein